MLIEMLECQSDQSCSEKLKTLKESCAVEPERQPLNGPIVLKAQAGVLSRFGGVA